MLQEDVLSSFLDGCPCGKGKLPQFISAAISSPADLVPLVLANSLQGLFQAFIA
jgi:hypothetical protein